MDASTCVGFEQILDLAPGLFLDPGVDGLPRPFGRVAEVDRDSARPDS